MRVRPNPHTIYLSYHFFPHQYLHCVVLSASPHTKYTQADMSVFLQQHYWVTMYTCPVREYELHKVSFMGHIFWPIFISSVWS